MVKWASDITAVANVEITVYIVTRTMVCTYRAQSRLIISALLIFKFVFKYYYFLLV